MEREPEHGLPVLPAEIWGEIVQYLDRVETWATLADVNVGLRDAVSKIPGVYQVDGREGLVEALEQADARYIIVVQGGLTVDRAPDNGEAKVVTRRGGMTVSGAGRLFLVGKGASATINGGSVFAYDGARIETVTGGFADAYGNATITTVTDGGFAAAYGNSTITTVNGGGASAYGNATITTVNGRGATIRGNAVIKAVTAGEIYALDTSTVAGVTGGKIIVDGAPKVFLEVAAQVDNHSHVVGEGVTVRGFSLGPIPDTVTVTTPEGQVWPRQG